MKDSRESWGIEDDPGCQFVYEEALGGSYALRFWRTIGAFDSALAKGSNSRPSLVIADIRPPDGCLLGYLDSEKLGRLSQIPILVISAVDTQSRWENHTSIAGF